MTIIVSEGDGEARRLDRRPLGSEKELQQYLYAHPECLPLYEHKEDVELLVLVREFLTTSGSIDALAVDQDGEIYVIETKLYKNADKRRVLAQVLDYGAALWGDFGDPNDFIQSLDAAVNTGFELGLREKVTTYFSFENTDADSFIASLRDNVSEGNFRYVVLMDQLSDRLKNLITYVNENSRFDLFGVELDFYRYGQFDILRPKLYGAEAKKNVSGSSASARKRWSEKSFFEDASNRLVPDPLRCVRDLYTWSIKQADRVSWGSGPERGSFNPKFDHVSQKSVFTVYSDGQIQINFGWLNEPEHAREYGEGLGSALRVRLPEYGIPADFMGNHASIPVKDWSSRLPQFIQILEEVLFPSEYEA